MNWKDVFVDTPAGRIHALEAGEGDVLILMHSNGGSAYEYEHVIEPLSKHFRVIAWDQPGQGDSDPITKHFTVRDYADALAGFLDALGIEKAHILGDSIGGAVTAVFGAHYPDRHLKLFMVECPYRTEEESKAMWPRTEANYCPAVQTMEQVKPRLRHVDEEVLKRWNIDRSKAGSKTCMSVMWALREYDLGPDLEKIPPGHVVMFGDKGPNVNKADRFRAKVKDPHIHVLKDCGHFPMLDDPDEFCRIVRLETGVA